MTPATLTAVTLAPPGLRAGAAAFAFRGTGLKVIGAVESVTPLLFAVLPSVAFVMTAAPYLSAGFGKRRIALAHASGYVGQAADGASPGPDGRPGWAGSNQTAVMILQFLVGGLVTMGGFEFARNAVYPFGTALGLIHLSIGLAGLATAFLILRAKSWSPRRLLLAVNGLTVAYSSFSETAVYVFSLLGTYALDSLIGTVVALVMSFTIIYLLLSSGEPRTRSRG